MVRPWHRSAAAALVLWTVGCAGVGEVPSTDPGAGGGGAQGGSDATSGVGGDSGGAGGANAGGSAAGCPQVPSCDTPPPDPGAAVEWNDASTPVLVTSQGAPRHRGRDLFLNPGEPQWILGKFAYGVTDKDLVGEDVDIYLDRGCAGSWELLGTATTTDDGDHPTVEGVEDTGGRIYFPIPAGAELGLGRHRVHLVVRGDLSSADVFIEVIEPTTTVFVSDVDGTLTTAETEEFTDLLTGDLPDANPSAPEALSLLAEKGARPMYLTARPEWLTERTREFLAARGFPPGIVHTTLSKVGALGDDAVSYKSAELAVLQERTADVLYVFGNTDSDAEAYHLAAIEPLSHRVFFQYDDTFGGRRIESYAEMIPELDGLSPVCE